MPFGIAGVMAGAAKCFYGYVGFDCVATTGEEAKNPQRNIPLSIVISLIIIFLSYFGVSTVLTMMWPYYLQVILYTSSKRYISPYSNAQNPTAPFPHVFQQIGWIEVKWIVTIGAIFALCTNLLGAMFPLPRVLYAMASDGILYKNLRKINDRTKTPLIATVVSGLLSATMALIFDLHQLIDMMSIGTLIAYTIVAICVLVLRYQCDATAEALKIQTTVGQTVQQMFNMTAIKQPNHLSSTITKFAIVIFSTISVGFCFLVDYMQFKENNIIVTIALVVVSIVMLLLVFVIACQPVSGVKLTFKVPFVPWIPCLSVLINLYLMFQLDLQTWIRFSVWGAIGKD